MDQRTTLSISTAGRFLRYGIAGLGLLGLNSPDGASRRRRRTAWSIRCTIPPKAKRVIFLYQAGGPSHLETFDYKPKLAEMHGKPCRNRSPRASRSRSCRASR